MFPRRWTVNALLVAAIALIVWLGGFFDPPASRQPALAVAGFDPGSIDRIEILGTATPLTLVRRAGRWWLAEPASWPADRNAVERLFDIVTVGDTQPLDSGGIDPSSLGLDESGLELYLGDTRIRFGTSNIIGERRYTMIGSDIYLLADVYRPLLERGLPGFVDRRLLPPDMELTTLSFPEAEIRRADSGWQVLPAASLSPQQAAQLAAGWQQLEASRLSVFGAAETDPQAVIAHVVDGRSYEFLLLTTRPEIIIANPPLGLQYHFRAPLRDQLLPPVGDEDPA
jgi:hypothetical protein